MTINVQRLHGFDLNSLLTFFLIYQEHSVSRAALRLNVTQPAVSNTLAKLRIQFRDPLFIRNGRTLVPTRRAQTVADELAPAFMHIETALGHLH
ncbi:LysR family transcriptional regulator [Pseudomonas syringae]|jgi:LysR family transcriptional activator of mexEF-oprN operon|nr:LysR family transcriptional regulator [Pseudomonas syringae]